jgi:hypothetical protein
VRLLLSFVSVSVALVVGAAAGVAVAIGLTVALMALNPDNGIAGMVFLPVGFLAGAIAGGLLAKNWVTCRPGTP